MALLADVPNRARFNLTYADVLNLPIWLRTEMVEQINEWRSQEASQEAKMKAAGR